MRRWIKSRTRLAHSWIPPAKATRFCGVKLKRFWLQVNEQAGLLKHQVLVSRRRLFKISQADSLVRQTIGHYKISESIGTGGMGEVYLATDITAGRKAALKLLPLRFTGDAERLKRFQQEARAVVGLNHPNILTVYEISEDHSSHYIASELIEGETLRQHLMRGRMELVKLLTSRPKWRVRSLPLTTRELFIATSSRRTSCSGRTAT